MVDPVMPARRPGRPLAARVLSTPKVADAQVSRALADVGAAVREVQRDPSLPRQIAKGDMFFVDATGGIVRLPIGTAGQALRVGTSGLPEWS